MRDSNDLQRLLRVTPGLHVLLRPDTGFTIVAASEDYLRTSHTDESIIGRSLFEAFPDNPAASEAAGSGALRDSLARVIASGEADRMPVLRYDVRRPEKTGGGFEERYWTPVNVPVLD